MSIRKLMGDRSFYRRLTAVMLPILVQNLITNFVNLLDNVMVGQVGTEPMSGVAIVNQLLFVFNLCLFGGVSGAGVLTAQFHGNKDQQGVAYTLRAKLMIAAVIVIVALGIFISSGEELIMLFIHEGQEGLDMAATLEYGKAYMKVMLIQMVPFAITWVYACTLRETGETLLPMKSGIAAVLINLVFNYLLIFGKFGFPQLGVVGAAIATVLSRFVECFIIIIGAHRNPDRKASFGGAYRSVYIPASLLKKILLMGLPLMLNELLWSGGTTTLNQCYSMRGLEVVSAVNISSTVNNLFFCVFLAMGNAVSIMVGQLLGAGKLEEAIEEDTRLLIVSVVLSCMVAIVMGLLAPVIPLLYNTTDSVRALAGNLLTVAAFAMPIHAFANSCYFTLRSGGKTGITFVFDSLYMWVLSVPVAFVLSRFTEVKMLYMFIIVQSIDLFKCALGFYLVKKRKWVKNLVK